MSETYSVSEIRGRFCPDMSVDEIDAALDLIGSAIRFRRMRERLRVYRANYDAFGFTLEECAALEAVVNECKSSFADALAMWKE